jgi:hypothetical protein
MGDSAADLRFRTSDANLEDALTGRTKSAAAVLAAALGSMVFIASSQNLTDGAAGGEFQQLIAEVNQLSDEGFSIVEAYETERRGLKIQIKGRALLGDVSKLKKRIDALSR